MTSFYRVLGAVLVTMSVLAGCTSTVSGKPPAQTSTQEADGGSLSAGPIDLEQPIEIYAVISAHAEASTPQPGELVLKDRSGVAYVLDDQPVLTITRVQKLESYVDVNSGWYLDVTVEEPDKTTLLDYTASHLDQQIAIVVEQRIVVAPVIAGPIDGALRISGNFTEQEAKDLWHDLAGR